MPYTLIKGEFHIHYPDSPRQGPEPDGDTVKFKPDNPMLVENLPRPGSTGPRFNRRGMVNLRFEGIDALETHFVDMHQNLQWAEAARDGMLTQLGFGEVEFFDDLPFKVQRVENHPVRGYMLANTLDGFGRIISFLYSGNHPAADGASLWVETEDLEESLNAWLLDEGLVYPAFYTSLPINLKNTLRQRAERARENEAGLWPHEDLNTEKFAALRTLDELQQLVMWPKLFRRLARYFAAGYTGLDQFDAWLRADPINRDDRLILPDRELGNMHDMIVIEGDCMKLRYEPEEIIILPDNATGAVVTPPAPVVRQAGAVRIVAALVNPIGRERGAETVTLINLSPDEVSLAGWRLVDRAQMTQALSGDIAPGATRQITLSAGLPLGNRGDAITLVDNAGMRVDQVSYKAKDAAHAGWTLLF